MRCAFENRSLFSVVTRYVLSKISNIFRKEFFLIVFFLFLFFCGVWAEILKIGKIEKIEKIGKNSETEPIYIFDVFFFGIYGDSFFFKILKIRKKLNIFLIFFGAIQAS